MQVLALRSENLHGSVRIFHPIENSRLGANTDLRPFSGRASEVAAIGLMRAQLGVDEAVTEVIRIGGHLQAQPIPTEKRIQRMCDGAIEIRDAKAADRDAVFAVTLRAFEQYEAVMPGHWELYRENIRETLAHAAPAQQIVAEVGGTVAGAVLLYPAGFEEPDFDGLSRPNPWPVVRLLAVPPEFRGRGIGRTLMEECVRRAAADGCDSIMLHSSEIMKCAVSLYLGLGFVRDSDLDLTVAPGVTIDGYRLDVPREL